MDAERALWSGHPSHRKDLGYHLACLLFAWLVFPLFLSLARYLQTSIAGTWCSAPPT